MTITHITTLKRQSNLQRGSILEPYLQGELARSLVARPNSMGLGIAADCC